MTEMWQINSIYLFVEVSISDEWGVEGEQVAHLREHFTLVSVLVA